MKVLKVLIAIVCIAIIGCVDAPGNGSHRNVAGVYLITQGTLNAEFDYGSIAETYTAANNILLNVLQSNGAILFHTCIGILVDDEMVCDLSVPSSGGCMQSMCSLEFNGDKLLASIHFEVTEYFSFGVGDYELELERMGDLCDATPRSRATQVQPIFDWRLIR